MSLATQPPRSSGPRSPLPPIPPVLPTPASLTLGNGVALILDPLRGWLRRISTPTLLQLLLGATWVSVLLFWIAAYAGVSVCRRSFEQVGRETIPAAAQTYALHAALSALDADATHLLLLQERARSTVEVAATRDAYEAQRFELADAFVSSAEHLSTDARERTLLVQLQAQVGHYEASIARALTLQGIATDTSSQRTALTAYEAAQSQLDNEIEGTFTSLQGVEESRYQSALAGQNGERRTALFKVTACGLLALVVLVLAQYALFGRTRRIINPGLGGATLLTLVLLCWSLGLHSNVTRNLASASYNGSPINGRTFTALRALAAARRNAHDARAAESHALLAESQEVRQSSLYRFDSQLFSLRRPISDGLNYSAQLDAYENAHRALVDQLPEGGSPRALGVLLSSLVTSSDQAFNDLDAALKASNTAFQSDFQTAIDTNLSMLRTHEILISLLALAIAACALFGIAPRLREYAF